MKRCGKEQYYTKDELASSLVCKLNELMPLDTFDLIIEPSAGTGAFMKYLPEDKLFACDIEPKYKGIECMNYLETTFETINRNILVIGNPPFGRQSTLAKQFIKHSCKFASVIAFILPLSFKKVSMSNSFSLNFHKIYEQELPLNSFIYESNEYSVPCVFQVYLKRDTERYTIPKIKENELYKVVKHTESYNLVCRRVGFYAGKFSVPTDNYNFSPQSHYFIQWHNDVSPDILIKLNTIQWETNNTTGPKSISKQELFKELNVLYWP